ncbi:MAG: hypothetical protein JW976_02115 [Syntrophaceae bacterium]|nr:hypothetical protein [Syntrophaceae bacterium]
MPLYKITGIGKKTNRKRVHVYEADTQEQAYKKAYKDGTIIDDSATEIIPYPPASEYQLNYAKSLGIDCPVGITEREISDLIEEAQQWASPKQIRLVKELGLEAPDKKMTWDQMSEFIDNALEDPKINKRYEKLPPTEEQLKKAKEMGVRIPWFATRQKLSILIEEAIEKERHEKYQRDMELYNERIAQDDGTVRGRYIHDKAALEAIRGLIGVGMVIPDVKVSARIFKGDKRGNIDAHGKDSSAKKVINCYSNLLKEKGFAVDVKSSNFTEGESCYYLTFKSEKRKRNE